MMRLACGVDIPEAEIEISAIRAQGAGGQNVNKVSSAVHLRFDVRASSLPEEARERVLALTDRRLSKDGVIVIKAQRFRSLDANREDALERLRELLDAALVKRVKRIATRPGKAARQRRMDDKGRRATVKAARRPVAPHD